MNLGRLERLLEKTDVSRNTAPQRSCLCPQITCVRAASWQSCCFVSVAAAVTVALVELRDQLQEQICFIIPSLESQG